MSVWCRHLDVEGTFTDAWSRVWSGSVCDGNVIEKVGWDTMGKGASTQGKSDHPFELKATLVKGLRYSV